ncbi:T9SS type A sorting domain-containing protein [bacterium]|nr:T9SS type A sorting domain-containing protein [bacterium]
MEKQTRAIIWDMLRELPNLPFLNGKGQWHALPHFPKRRIRYKKSNSPVNHTICRGPPKRFWKIAFLTLLILLFGSLLIAGQITITGHYVDKKNNPIVDASVAYFANVVRLDSTNTDNYGKFSLNIQTVGIEPEHLPQQFSLSQNYPNPFNPETRIQCSTVSSATLSLFNLRGHLIDKVKLPTAGKYSLTWGGADRFGNSVSAGIYFIVLTDGDKKLTRRLTLLDSGNGSNLRLETSSHVQPAGNYSNTLRKSTGLDEIHFIKPNTSMKIVSLTTPAQDTTLDLITGNVGPRIIGEIPTQNIMRGDSATINLNDYVYNDEKGLFLPADTENFKVEQDTLLKYYGKTAGEKRTTIEVVDREDQTLRKNLEIIVNVAQGNLPPSINLPDTLTINEDDTLRTLISNLNLYRTDSDTDQVFYLLEEQSNEALINTYIDGDKLKISDLLANGYGENKLRISINDSEYSNSDEVVIKVQSVNDAPIFNSNIENQTTKEDSLIRINTTSYFSDVDDDTLSYIVKNLSNANYTVKNGIITITPSPDWNGTLEGLIIEAADKEGLKAESNGFNLNVEAVNDAPVQTSNIENQEVSEGETLKLAMNNYVIDAENDLLTYTLLTDSLVNWSQKEDSLIITPDSNFTGNIENMLITVSDGQASTILNPFNLNVKALNTVTFIIKDFKTDTTLISDTSTFWIDNEEYKRVGGVLTVKLKEGTYEFNATNPNTIDGKYMLEDYLFLRRPGKIENFEQRAGPDNSSEITIAQNDTILAYKIMSNFPMSTVVPYLNEDWLKGTVRFGPNDLEAPARWNMNYDPPYEFIRDYIIDLLENEIPQATLGKLHLQYYESTEKPTVPYLALAMDSSFPGPGTNGTLFNENNIITTCSANWPPTPNMYTTWIEILQAIADLPDLNGIDPPIVSYTTELGPHINELGQDIFSLLYFIQPNTYFISFKSSQLTNSNYNKNQEIEFVKNELIPYILENKKELGLYIENNKEKLKELGLEKELNLK